MEVSDHGSKRLWTTIRNLSNPRPKTQPVLTFGEVSLHSPKKCAAAFNRQFVEHPGVPSKRLRSVRRRLGALPRSDEHAEITAEEVLLAVKSAKSSTAIGPDGLAMVMLKHIGPMGAAYLAKTFNLSLSMAIIPDGWKTGKIIPVPKSGKPLHLGSSYRPITLLSPVVKILEALILPTLKDHLPMADHQHGFRAGHSTTTALLEMTTGIADGLNSKRPHNRTLMVALDLSKAFNTVCHATLVDDLLDSTLPPTYKRWLGNYMRGRQSYVEFRGQKSRPRKSKQGVPQGGVLSPLLFNFYVSGIPPPPTGVTLVSYADDCTILSRDRSIEVLERRMNDYLPLLKQYFSDRNLQLSEPKSTATLFTTWTREVSRELDVRIDGQKIPTVKHPKVLGVTFDNLFMFAKHTEGVAARVKGRNRILKALSGSTWGKDKETILATYKAIGRPLMDYAAPAWSPAVSDAQWSALQTVQNAALRTATGCHMMADVDHLHAETMMLKVREHCSLISQQFLLGCEVDGHPNHLSIRIPLSHRAIRDDLRRDREAIAHLVDSDLSANLKLRLGTLHTEAVGRAISSLKDNIVLGGRPPPISNSELKLPRSTRATLSQLRSGYSKFLCSYLARTNEEVSAACPLCELAPHTTEHLFECVGRPTELTTIDLWTRPIEVARFLALDVGECLDV